MKRVFIFAKSTIMAIAVSVFTDCSGEKQTINHVMIIKDRMPKAEFSFLSPPQTTN